MQSITAKSIIVIIFFSLSGLVSDLAARCLPEVFFCCVMYRGHTLERKERRDRWVDEQIQKPSD